MRDTIRGIVGKLRKGTGDYYILVAVDTKDYTIHSFWSPVYGMSSLNKPDLCIIGWYKDPIKMSALREQIERKIGGISL